MRIGVFSKLGASGGSEHRCAELSNGILRHTDHTPVLLCEKDLNSLIRARLLPGVPVVERVFKPVPQNPAALYEVDRLVVVNSDSYSFATLDYWEGRTEHHASTVDLHAIPQMTFLFNFVISPAQHLWTVAQKCPDVRIICANGDYVREINERPIFQRVRTLPRITLPSPIDPDTVCFEKTPSDKIRIGKHSKPYGYKFNEDHARLIEGLNARYGDRIAWDFLGVPAERREELRRFPNVRVREEYSIAVGEYLRGIDLFLFFISWSRSEPWSRCVAEAMLSGCPVLATDRAGNRDQVMHENNGYLCGSTEAFHTALAHLIEHPDLIRRLGRNARISARAFESAQVIHQFVEFLLA